jgi:hypothetical protein
MITRQLIVKKKFDLLRPKKQKKSSDEQFLQAPRNWQKCSALVVGPIKQLFDKLINFHYLKLIVI